MATRQVPVALWRYRCAECGIGDGETGHMAPDHAIYCEVCLEDGRRIRLSRWAHEPEEDAPKG